MKLVESKSSYLNNAIPTESIRQLLHTIAVVKERLVVNLAELPLVLFLPQVRTTDRALKDGTLSAVVGDINFSWN